MTEPLTIDRLTYNRFLAKVALELGVWADQVDQAVANEYPKPTVDVLVELRARGWQATEWLLNQYGRKYLRTCGGAFLWNQTDIDHLASELSARGLFTEAAKAAGRAGWTAEQLIGLVAGPSQAIRPAVPEPEAVNHE